MVEAFLGERGEWLIVCGGVGCGTRPGVNSPTKHQRKVLIKHQVNSRKSTSSCSDWVNMFYPCAMYKSHCASQYDTAPPSFVLSSRIHSICLVFSILYSSTIKCSSVLSQRLSDFLSDPHELRGSCCSDNWLLSARKIYIVLGTQPHFFLCLRNYLFSEARNTSFLRKYLFWLGRKNTLVCQPNVFRTGKEVVRCQTQNGDLAQTSFPRKLAKISEKTCKDFSEPGKANPWLWICVGNGMIFSKFVMKCYHKVRVTNKAHSDFLEKVYMLMLLNK